MTKFKIILFVKENPGKIRQNLFTFKGNNANIKINSERKLKRKSVKKFVKLYLHLSQTTQTFNRFDVFLYQNQIQIRLY